MRYPRPVLPGVFLARPNRFVARVLVAGREAVCHVKNTGRCAELLTPGAQVFVQPAAPDSPRKTAFDLVAVYKGSVLFNLDSQAPNLAAGEFLRAGGIWPAPALVRPETAFGDSRFDFYIEHAAGRAFVEVKGVTLEENGTALFPDAPTLRGAKHLRGLARAVRQGYGAAVLFVLQFAGAARFCPNRRTDPAFAAALLAARDAGVQVLAVECAVTSDSMQLTAPVPVDWSGE